MKKGQQWQWNRLYQRHGAPNSDCTTLYSTTSLPWRPDGKRPTPQCLSHSFSLHPYPPSSPPLQNPFMPPSAARDCDGRLCTCFFFFYHHSSYTHMYIYTRVRQWLTTTRNCRALLYFPRSYPHFFLWREIVASNYSTARFFFLKKDFFPDVLFSWNTELYFLSISTNGREITHSGAGKQDMHRWSQCGLTLLVSQWKWHLPGWKM